MNKSNIKEYSDAYAIIRKIIRKIKREFIWYYKFKFNSRVQTSLSFPVEMLVDQLSNEPVLLLDYHVPPEDFQNFIESCDYPSNYHGGRGLIFIEKCIEHYLSLELLEIQKSDIYIDIASGKSPFPEFIRRTIGCKVFRSDLSYPLGIYESYRIGGDSTRIPLPNCSVTKASLHCSFEHFEGDADITLIKELHRLLVPGGLVCIIPFYLHNEFSIATDPFVNGERVIFNPGAKVVYLRNYGQRHGRFYDIKNLKKRILDNLGTFSPRFYRIQNLGSIDKKLWCHFALVLQKPW
jgi:SAM-dependent methyltransferase